MKIDKEKYLKLIVLVVFLISIFSMLLVYFSLFISDAVMLDKAYQVDRKDFISSAQWVQTIAVIATACFSYLLYTQVMLTQEQVSLERQSRTSEAYKNIAATKYRKTRQLVFDERMMGFFEKTKYLVEKICEKRKCFYSIEDFNKKLYEIRSLFDFQKMNFSNNELCDVSLSSIEELLNEYNAFGLLINEGAFDSRFLPKSAINNAIKFYDIVEPYIKFRQMSPFQDEYASDYVVWIQKEKKRKLDLLISVKCSNIESKNSELISRLILKAQMEPFFKGLLLYIEKSEIMTASDKGLEWADKEYEKVRELFNVSRKNVGYGIYDEICVEDIDYLINEYDALFLCLLGGDYKVSWALNKVIKKSKNLFITLNPYILFRRKVSGVKSFGINYEVYDELNKKKSHLLGLHGKGKELEIKKERLIGVW